ncbi:MAG: hypothetical protein IH608_09990, partial [Proteobacteria bacterium]|nr:hypothetical protein [Pseudomonadota bacterium]
EVAEARLAGASARLELRALRDLTAAGETLAAGETRVWTCSETTAVELEGVARISVTPGGADLPRLREEAVSRGRTEEELLAELGVRSLAEAEEQWERRQEVERRALQLTGFLKARCPEGLPFLEAQAEKARRVLENLGPEDPEAPDPAGARAGVEGAAEAEETARARRDAGAAALAALRVDLGRAEQRSQGLLEERARLLQVVEQMPSLAVLQETAAAAESGWQEALAAREGLRRRYEALGGAGARADLSREETATSALEDQRRGVERTREQLVGTLAALQGEALHEREQEAEAVWTRAKQALDSTARWAEAARTLAEALHAARREAQERLTAPVRARVEPYLRQVFPGSGLGLSEDWEVRGLATGNLEEPFAELSGGAREQLGLLVRVGLAELLAGADRLPLVLDDALPNTDFERVERLHRVLYQAARKLQILVFSCHPEAFDGLGADRTYLLPARVRG